MSNLNNNDYNNNNNKKSFLLLTQKKIILENKLKNIINFQNSFIFYKKLLNLIKIDNTNENLLNLYLKYSLKYGGKTIKKSLEKYKIYLSDLIQNKIFPNKKQNLNFKQKIIEYFLILLEKNDNEIINFIKSNKKRFKIQKNFTNLNYIHNQNIYFYYIFIELIKVDYKISKKIILNFHEYFSKNIYNNIELIYISIIIINSNENFNYSLINESNEIKENLCKNFNNNFIKINLNVNEIIFFGFNKKLIIKDYEKFCFKKLINSTNENNFFTEENLNNSLLFNEFNKSNFIFKNSLIKNKFFIHLQNILESKLFEDFFNKNYNTNFEYLFKIKNSFNELKENLFFFPFVKNYNINNINSFNNICKKTLNLFISLNPIFINFNEKISKLLNISNLIINIINEIFYFYVPNYYNYYLNSKNFIVKKFFDIKEIYVQTSIFLLKNDFFLFNNFDNFKKIFKEIINKNNKFFIVEKETIKENDFLNFLCDEFNIDENIINEAIQNEIKLIRNQFLI